MNKKNTKTLLIVWLISLIATIISCSQTQQKATKEYSGTQDSSEQADLNELKTQLENSVLQALKDGPKQQNYLADSLFLKASHAQMSNDFKLANVYYSQLLRLTQDKFVKTKYVVSLIREGELATAQKYLLELYQAQSLGAKDEKIGLILAGVYTGQGKREEARQIYSELLEQNKKNSDACVFLAKSFSLDQKLEQALSVLNSCAKEDPKNALYPYYIGKVYLDQNKLAEAKMSFIKAQKLDAQLSQATLAIGLIEEEEGKIEQAIKTYQAHLKSSPEDSIILNRLVMTMFAVEKFKEVIPYAEQLSDLDQGDLNLKVKLGILYTDSKMYQEAISTFQGLLEHDPKSDKIHYYLGAIYQETADFVSAIDHFNKIPPESALFHDSSVQIAQMMQALIQGADHPDMLTQRFEDFDQFISNRKAHSPALAVELTLVLAHYYEKIERRDLALSSLEQVQSLKEFGHSHKYYMASLLEKEKKFQAAYKLMEGILKEDPNNAHAMNFIGYSLVDREVEMDRAFELISKAIELAPDDGYIRDSLGWYYYKKGKYQRALTELTKAYQSTPNDVVISRHLALIYQKLNQLENAKKYLVEALKNAEQETEKTEIFKELEQIEQKRRPAGN